MDAATTAHRGKLDPAVRTSLSGVFYTQLHPENGGWRVALSTRTPGKIDTGDQLIDRTSQSSAERRFELELN
jgi:hypothetical protein